jgi:hypothetical protein
MKRVYFIKAVGMRGPIKIGCSFSPTGRKNGLQAWSPLPLEIIAEIDGGHDIERRFHQRFLETHKAYEWFYWSQDLQDTIEAIRAGTFDIATLPVANGSPLEKGKTYRGTPESRKQQSYSLRVANLSRRSGWSFAGDAYRIVQSGREAEADAYLAEPHIHGKPIDAPWAELARSKWMEKLNSAVAPSRVGAGTNARPILLTGAP